MVMEWVWNSLNHKWFISRNYIVNAKKTALVIDSESIDLQVDEKMSIYGSLEVQRDRRSGKDRRKFKYTTYIPERRSCIDRRGVG